MHREEEEVTSAAVKLYQRAARRLGVTPLRKVLTQLGKERMTFRNLTLTARDMKALCIGLLVRSKLQALVYGIFPPSAAVIQCAIGLGKLSTSGQILVRAQMTVGL